MKTSPRFAILGVSCLLAAATIRCKSDSSNGGSAGGGNTGSGGDGAGGNGSGGNASGAGSGGSPTGGTAGDGSGGTSGTTGSPDAGAGGAPAACVAPPRLKLTLVTKALIPAAWTNSGWRAAPLALVQAKGGSPILVAQRGGHIRILRNNVLEATPFLDMSASIADIPRGTSGERGLINLALHPDYANNGRFFVFYTGGRNDPYSDALEGDIVVAEGKRSAANPDRANPALRPLLIVEHSEDAPQNYDDGHNGGLLVFGKDGFLWTAVGDGGNAWDYFKTGQDPNHPLAKLYRLDVDNPPANPHAVSSYVWAMGQRNPWRGSVDPDTGDLYIGDVHEGHWEEINWQPFGTPKGLNYGWGSLMQKVNGMGSWVVPGMEGSHCFPSYVKDCTKFGVMPLHEYAHKDTGAVTVPTDPTAPPVTITERTAVVAGFVYRGGKIPGMQGRFVWGDHGTNVVKSFINNKGTVECLEDHTTDLANAVTPLREIGGFGEDAERELYVFDMDRLGSARNSSIYKIEAE